MSNNITTDPVTELAVTLLARGYPAALVADLDQRLRGEIAWVPLPGVPHVRAWEGRSGDWTFALADFPIGEQPGRQPDERGQNLGIGNASLGTSILSDDPALHHVAAWLIARIPASHSATTVNGGTKKSTDTFVGSGKIPLLRVGSIPDQTQKFLLKDEATIKAAIAWTENHIAKIKDQGTWFVPRSNSSFRFDKVNKVAYTTGHDQSVEMVLFCMGYRLEPEPELSGPPEHKPEPPGPKTPPDLFAPPFANN